MPATAERLKLVSPQSPEAEAPQQNLTPENSAKAARKLYSDANFTISKLQDRAKRALRDVGALTITRHENEQLHAFGTPSADETAGLQVLSSQIDAKLTKAREELDWEPKVGLFDGIQRTLAWYKENVEAATV